MPDLSIILLTYNSQNSIEACLESLRKNHNKDLENGAIELVITDNNSQDDTEKKVKAFLQTTEWKLQKIHKNESNLGFAKGINTAAKTASAPYILFLNPDARLTSGNLLDMQKYMAGNKQCAICGGKLYESKTKTENNASKDISLAYVAALMLSLDEKLGFRFSPNKPQIVPAVSGGFMMVKKEIFEKIHGFDEDFFMYFEDIDLCKRMKDHGFTTNFYPYVKAAHAKHGSANRGYAIVNIYKGLNEYAKKHKNTFEQNMIKFMLAAKAIAVIIVSTLTSNKEHKKTYNQALSSII